MVRKPRLDFPYLLYHVTARGNNRQKIFLAEENDQSFFNSLLKVKQKL